MQTLRRVSFVLVVLALAAATALLGSDVKPASAAVTLPALKAALASSTCLSPPANVDHATLSNANLAKYGLPQRGSMPLVKWENLVRLARHRVCSSTPTAGSQIVSKIHPNSVHNPHPAWDGNYAEGNSGPFNEVDSVFFVPCIKPSGPDGEESSWVGLGGITNTPLVQAGIVETKNYLGYSYYAAYENYPLMGSPARAFQVNCNNEMQAVVTNDSWFINDVTLGGTYWFYSTTSPTANESTAEWIVERVLPNNLCDFQSETFYGMGDTNANTNYYGGPIDQTHDYFSLVGSNGNPLVYIGGLDFSTNYGPPNDDNTLTWHASS